MCVEPFVAGPAHTHVVTRAPCPAQIRGDEFRARHNAYHAELVALRTADTDRDQAFTATLHTLAVRAAVCDRWWRQTPTAGGWMQGELAEAKAQGETLRAEQAAAAAAAAGGSGSGGARADALGAEEQLLLAPVLNHNAALKAEVARLQALVRQRETEAAAAPPPPPPSAVRGLPCVIATAPAGRAHAFATGAGRRPELPPPPLLPRKLPP